MRLWKRKRQSGAICSCCGRSMGDGLPAMGFDAPVYWQDSFADDPKSFLDSDFCCIKQRSFFVRTVLELPIHGAKEPFIFGVWVSLSKKNLNRYRKVFGTSKELDEEPYFGWFANEIPIYPSCLAIETNVYLQGNGNRPKLLLNHDNPHPLCQEQHEGISQERAHEIIALLTAKEG